MNLDIINQEARMEDPQYGLVDNEEHYETVIPGFFALRLQQNQPNAHAGSGSDLTTYPLLD